MATRALIKFINSSKIFVRTEHEKRRKREKEKNEKTSIDISLIQEGAGEGKDWISLPKEST